MDRNTILFFIISAGLLLAWAHFFAPDPPPPSERETGDTQTAATPENGADETQAPPSAKIRAVADLKESGKHIKNSGATVVETAAFTAEIAHSSASFRSLKLKQYPMRSPKGRLIDDSTVDLIPVYLPDYGSLRFGGAALEWRPLGSWNRVVLNSEGDTEDVSFQAELNGVEIVKTFTFTGVSEEALRAGSEGAWRGYAIDVSVKFHNQGAPEDILAGGYELRWGPGIAMDREPPTNEFGIVGGMHSTGPLDGFTELRDHMLTEPGPQNKDGSPADAVEQSETIWSAIHSKYFIAALIGGGLGEKDRSIHFSEYDAFPLDFPREPDRHRLLMEIGKEWLVDDAHFGQKKPTHLLLIPTGTRQMNADIEKAARKEDGRKSEENLKRIYAEYGDAQNLLTGARLSADGFLLPEGRSLIDRFRIYAGPKHTALLKDVVLANGDAPAQLNQLVSFGFTGPLAKGLLWLLKLFHALFRNYGVAIIILTILVRLAMYPLTKKSSEAMKKSQSQMKIIQPMVDEVKKKYSADPQRMQVETMKVFRKYGVNPMSGMWGCLMMLPQMPIFFAMFTMLQNSAELRGEPFMLWIDDLTAPDMMFSIFGLPVRALPILMTVGTLLQQRMLPAASPMGGNQQKMMMYLMPLIFFFLFYNWASGLNLYWGASTLLGVGMQFLVGKFGKQEEEEQLTPADLERRARLERKKKQRRRRTPARPSLLR